MVANLSVFLLSLLSLTLNNSAQHIEKSFLQNDPAYLYALFDVNGYINVSLPAPISFSDQVSNEQAFYLFRKIFDSYSTFEFYSDREPTPVGRKSIIFKARWSFQDQMDSKHVLFIFFYMIRDSGQDIRLGGKDHISQWKITEIRAVKL
jgi:hypothetical protein